MLIDIDKFKSHIFNKSFFDEKKLLIIDKITDKALPVLKNLFGKEFDDVVVILKAGVLEKKSKLRLFFEKHKQVIVTPFYEDNHQTLFFLITDYFKKKSIKISNEIVNLIIELSGSNRIIINNELDKISSFLGEKKTINFNHIIKLLKSSENFPINEILDHIILKNKKKSLNIMNRSVFSIEDRITLARLLLYKLKRLKNIKIKLLKNKNIDHVFSTIKPPIFWKEKETLKQQLKTLSIKETGFLIKEVNRLELHIKKNAEISGQILNNFIMEKLI